MFIPYRDDNPWKRPPVVTYCLIAVNVIVMILVWRLLDTEGEAAVGALYQKHGLLPSKLQAHSLITYAFLHAGFFHLAFNMLFLWIFGDNVEDSLGSAAFLLFYLLGAALSGLTFVTFHQGSTTLCIGASGAVSAVVGACVVLYPEKRVRVLIWLFILYVQVVRVRAIVFVAFWFVFQFVFFLIEASSAGETSIAYSAHMGGFVFGVLAAALLRLTVVKEPAAIPEVGPGARRRRNEEILRQRVRAEEEKLRAYRSRPGARLQIERNVPTYDPLKDDRVHTADELLFGQEVEQNVGKRFSVIRIGAEDVDILDLVPIIATAAGLPRPDVSRMVRKSHGFILRGVDMPRAQNVVYRLKAHGIDTLTIEQDRLIQLPPALEAKTIGFDDNGLQAARANQSMGASWSDLAIACGGWVEKRIQAPRPPVGDDVDFGVAGHLPTYGGRLRDAEPIPYTRPQHVFAYPKHEKILTVDLVFASPWRRVRFCPENVRLGLMAERPSEPLKKVELLIGKMIEYADDGSVNVVLQDYVRRRVHVPSGRFTFSSEEAYDSYVFWLLQVKSFGGDINPL